MLEAFSLSLSCCFHKRYHYLERSATVLYADRFAKAQQTAPFYPEAQSRHGAATGAHPGRPRHSPVKGRPGHLQEGLQHRHGRVVHQQLEGPRRAHRRLRGVPVGQVQAQGLDAGTLRRGRPGRGPGSASSRVGRGGLGAAGGGGGAAPGQGWGLAGGVPQGVPAAGPTSRARLSRSAAVRLSAVTRAPALPSATATARPIPAGRRRQPPAPVARPPPGPRRPAPVARTPLPAPVTRARRPWKLRCGSMLR